MKPKRIRGVSPELQESAQQLRQHMTPAEKVLWSAIRDKQLDGIRFRRQHPVGQFVLDFCAPTLRLVIEVDGPIHRLQSDQDASRTEHLEAFGYRVIRFQNAEVISNLPKVLEKIQFVTDELRRNSPHPPTPSPNSGRGGWG